MEQHEVEFNPAELHLVALHPPRKRFWDYLPIVFCEWYLRRDFHNPKATPYEVWIIHSALLRSKYKALRQLIEEMAAGQDALQKLIERVPAAFIHSAPDGPKVNPEDLN